MRVEPGATQDDGSIVETVLSEFLAGLVSAIPGVLSGIHFLLLAYVVVIEVVLTISRSVFDRL